MLAGLNTLRNPALKYQLKWQKKWVSAQKKYTTLALAMYIPDFKNFKIFDLKYKIFFIAARSFFPAMRCWYSTW